MLRWQIEKNFMGNMDLLRLNAGFWLYVLGRMTESEWHLHSYLNPTKQVGTTGMLQRLSKKETGSLSCPLLCYGNGDF